MEIIKEKLIQIGTLAYNQNQIKEGKELDLWIRRRNSLIYKLEFLNISTEHIFKAVDDMQKEVSLINPQDNRKIYDACSRATKTITYHLECFIYHLLSSLDNLKSILPFFYTDLSMNTPTMRKMYCSIKKQARLNETHLRKFIDSKENKWLITEKRDDGLYGYRAEIYHWLSDLCGAQASLTFPSESFSYELKITLPEKLSKITSYQKEIEIKDFVKYLLRDYLEYVKNLLLSIEKDIM